MFVKVPIYFDVQGSLSDISIIAEYLQVNLENMLLERQKSLKMEIPKKDRKLIGLDDKQEVILIRKIQVLDGIR
jgi:hypothetical protein